MNTIPNRIALLKEQYRNCPMMTDHTLGFGLCGRQRYLFAKGWREGASLTNTLLRKSHAYSFVFDNMKPVIGEHELIVGQRDYALSSEEEQEWTELAKYWDMLPGDGGRRDHKSLDFEKLLKVGIRGLLEEIKAYREGLNPHLPEDMEKRNFYQCAELELHALLRLAKRYSEHAKKLAQAETGVRKQELLRIAEHLNRVPEYPASNFWEALQAMHFYSFCLYGLYQHGHPDRYLLPYYERDIKEGVLTKERAQELIDCFCLMYTTYSNSSSSIGFMVGGRDCEGNPVENELTRMFLTSIAHTKSADPSIGLCVTEETSEELLDFASRLLTEGYSHPALYNDTAITRSLMEYGVPKADAHCYIHSCCVEITVDKKSDVWVVSPYHNTLQYLLEVLRQAEEVKSFEELLSAFSDYLKQQITEKNNRENMWQLERSKNGNEPALVSCLVDDCLKRGMGIHRGGAVYNWTQPNFIGIANTVESLLVLEQFVFTAKELTVTELNRMLDCNYQGYERYRSRFLREVTHFGVGDDHADGMYQRVTEMITQHCKELCNFRGDLLIPAAFSYNEHIRHGLSTSASPDGRLAGDPLADGSGPVQGRDSDGPTSMLRSVTAWNQSPFLGGIAMNLKLQKNQSGDALKALIKTYFQRGGLELQVSAIDTEELRDAMLHPERHTDLLVRIGGYSDYFVSLSKELQQEVITRTESRLSGNQYS